MKKLLLVLFIVFLASGAPANEDVFVVTESLPPYQIQGNQKEITGLSTEIVKAVLNEAGVAYEIRMYPWTRAYKIALHKKNVLIYSIMRTQQREKLFKWVGAITPFDIHLFKLQSRKDIAVKSLDDAKKYKIGVVRDNAEDHYFTSLDGFKTQLYQNDILNIHTLFAGGVDLIPFNEMMLAYRMKSMGLNIAGMEKLIPLPDASAELYMAFNGRTSDELVEKIKTAFGRIKKQGLDEKIMKKYLP